MHDDAPLEESPIARQEDAPFAAGNLREFVVASVRKVQAVEPGETQVPRKLSA